MTTAEKFLMFVASLTLLISVICQYIIWSKNIQKPRRKQRYIHNKKY